MNIQIGEHYKEEYKTNFMDITNMEKLKFILFPFQEPFYDKNWTY